MGCSTAFFLRQRGLTVSLIERDLVGQHASGTNFGNLRRQGRPLAQLALANRASDIWRKARELLGTDIEYLQSGHARVCYRQQSDAADRMEEYARAAKDYGLSLEMLSGASLRRRLPFLGEEVLAASYSSQDGHANPRLVSPAFANAARERGALVFENTRIVAIQKLAEDFIVNSDSGVRFRAPNLVITAGAWASELSAQFGEPVPMTSFGPTMSVTEPVTYGIKPSVGVYTQEECESIYFRQIPRGNIIIGGSTRNTGQPNTCRTRVRPQNTLSQLKQIQRLAPSLGRLNIIRVWSGTEGYMPDGQPVFGPSERERGLYYAFAFSGSGFQIGPGVGDTLAELVATGSTDIDLHPYRVSRFFANGVQ